MRRVVEFLNGQMERTEVLAIEIKQYVGEGGSRSLVPRVLGQTVNAENVKGSARRSTRRWNEASFMKELKENASKADAAVAAKLIEWTRQEVGEPQWGSGTTMGSFSAAFNHDDKRHVLFDVWTTGRASIRFTCLKKHPPFKEIATRTALMERFNEIPGINLKKAGGWPEFPLQSLSSPSALEQFLRIIRYIGEEIRKQNTGTSSAV